MRIHYPQPIRESEAALATVECDLRGQPTAVRVQRLRLLKAGTVPSVAQCAPLVGYSATQLHRWWATYRTGGLAALLEQRTPPGKRSQLTEAAWAGLQRAIRAGRIARLADAQR